MMSGFYKRLKDEISYLRNKKPILRSNGKLIRDYLYVGDVARAYITLMNYMKKKKTLKPFQ